MIEETQDGGWFCNICANEWSATPKSRVPSPESRDMPESPVPSPKSPVESPESRRSARFATIEDLIARTGLRRDELATLAEIGALNAFGHDRRSALWQIERAIRPAGELFRDTDQEDSPTSRAPSPDTPDSRVPSPETPESRAPSPQSRRRSRKALSAR